MAAVLTYDLRISRDSQGNLASESVPVIQMTCCGALVWTDRVHGPGLALFLDTLHVCPDECHPAQVQAELHLLGPLSPHTGHRGGCVTYDTLDAADCTCDGR